MKVLAISGSPRKNGNTETVIKHITGIMAAKGYEVELVRLNDFSLQGCQACKYCRTEGDQCILKDGISETLEKLKEADRLVIGAPNYMANVSAQLKVLLDRMYSLKDSARKPRLEKGRTSVLVFAQGHPDRKAYLAPYQNVTRIIESNNIEVVDTIVANSVEQAGEVKDKKEIMLLAEQAAAKLL